MRVVILFVIGLGTLLLLANYLLKKAVSDLNKRKTWIIVTDLFICMIAVLAFLFYVKWAREQDGLYDSYMSGIGNQVSSVKTEPGARVNVISANNEMKLRGYIETDNGKHYDIDMVLNIKDVRDEYGLDVYGFYHYASQKPEQRIPLSGNLNPGMQGSSFIELVSYGCSERFLLAIAPASYNESVITGSWYQFKDKESCSGVDWEEKYDKKYNVVLSKEAK